MKRRAVSRPASINLEREAKIIRREIKLLGQDLKRATNRYVRIGGLLARCKDQLPYGEFMRWTSKNFALSHDTAARWIALAHRFKTDARFRTLRNLPVTVLYALDRQPELIDPILQRHASGETITPKTLKVAVRIERPPPEVVRFVPDYRPPSPLPPSRVPSLPMPRLSPPEPSQPSPESAAETAEWLGAATALFEAIAAIELPLPDTDVLAEAYRANPPKVSVDDIREIGSALGTLASKLAADATPAETPPEGWRH